MSEHYCGCCGREIPGGFISDPIWCTDCKRHILPGSGAPWNRTFYAQHRNECPFQVGIPLC